MRRFARTLSIVIASGAIVLPAAVGASAIEPSGSDGGVITLIADSPPSVAGGLDLRLLDVGVSGDPVDVTDERCGPLTTTEGSPIPTRQCDGLDDSGYFIQPVGGPEDAGLPTPVRCISPRDRQDESAGDIRIDEQTREWTCTVTVAPPGVVIDLEPDIGGGLELPVFDIDVLDADGDIVSNDCELDERLGVSRPRRWCAPLAEGSYETRPIGVPEGVDARAECARISAVRAQPRTGFDLTIEDQGPFYRCTGARQSPNLRLNIVWEGAFDVVPAWVEALTYSVINEAGDDVTSSCRRSDLILRGADTTIECFGLGDGVYDVVLDGLRDDFEFSPGCQRIEISAGFGFCQELIIYDTAVTTPPAATTPTTGSGPVLTRLPETGTPSSNTVLIAVMLLGAGAVLTAAGRRRSPTRTTRS